MKRPKGRDEPDYTRLFNAYAKGWSELIACATTADVNAQARDKRTILFDACGRNEIEAVRHLLSIGADVNHQDEEGLTPLHMAAIHYAVDPAAELLAAGADVNAQDQYGNTPLFRAIFESRGRGELINLLLEKGANPDIVNHHGVSPRSLAERMTSYDVKQFLR